MKRILIALALVSCSDSEPPTEVFVSDASPCFPEDVEGGVMLYCPNQDPVFIRDGQDCSITQEGSEVTYQCDGKEPVKFPVSAAPVQTPAQPTPPVPSEPASDETTCSLEKDDSGCIWAVCTDGSRNKVYNPANPHAL